MVSKLEKFYLVILSFIVIASTLSSAGSYFFTLSYHQTKEISSFNGTLSSIVFDPQNGLMYASSYYANDVFVYSPTNSTILCTIKMPIGPANGLFDPFNGFIYFTSIESSVHNFSTSVTVINTSTNTAIDTLAFGNFNFINSMALDTVSGMVYAIAETGLYQINGTELVHLNMPEGINKGEQFFTMDSATNEGFITDSIFSSEVYSLHNFSSNTSNIINSRIFGNVNSNIYFINFVNQTNQLFVSTQTELYSVDPANITRTLFTINLPNNGQSGSVTSMFYLASTNSFYITNGQNSIHVYNDSNGKLRGVIKVGDGGQDPTGLSYGPNGTLLVLAGSTLYSVNPVLTIPQSFWIIFITVTASFATASIYSIARFLWWKHRTI